MRATLTSLVVAITIVVSGCATGPAAPPGVNVTGTWAGTWAFENPRLGAGDVRGTFEQVGAKLTGRFEINGPNVVNHVSQIAGLVSGNEIKLTMPSVGYLTVAGDQMTGTVTGIAGDARWTMTKQ